MYRHILVAVDGSECSVFAATRGLELAKALGANVTIVTVTPTWKSLELSELALGHTEQEYEQKARARGDNHLQHISELAKKAGVKSEAVQVMHARPYQAILDTAEKYGCDLIVVGSHGRRGLEGLLLGSEASKVVMRSKVSVLVCRG
jgi:nucleotide-binding universal stress UspA family protein